MEPDVLYEDNHLLAVNKPGGVLVQGDETGDKPLVEFCKDYIGRKYNKPGAVFLGVIHRLDRPVSGVVLFARTSKALGRMNILFRDRKVRKTYWAMVETQPAQVEGKLIHWLKKNEQTNRTTAYPRETPGALQSELAYRVIGQDAQRWLLEVNPVTGRSHQIRVQLAAIGASIVGDVKYGAHSPLDDGTIGLHARCLEFVHPVNQVPLRIEAPLPGSKNWDTFQGISAD